MNLAKAFRQMYEREYLPDPDDHHVLRMTDDNLIKHFLEIDTEFDVFEAWLSRNVDTAGNELAVLLKSGDLAKLVREHSILREYQNAKGRRESALPVTRVRSP